MKKKISPSYVIFIGPGKCGTSTYSNVLKSSNNKNYCLSKVKETNFLLKPIRNNDLSNYHNYFDKYNSGPYVEVSNLYFFSNIFRNNLEFIQNYKLIVTLRDPLERLISHLFQYMRTKKYSSLDEALDCNQDVIYRSLFGYQLSKFLKYKENILILRLEDLKSRPKYCFDSLRSFTGLDLYQSYLSLPDNLKRSNSKMLSRSTYLTSILKSFAPILREKIPSLFERIRFNEITTNFLYTRDFQEIQPLSNTTIKNLNSIFKKDAELVKNEWEIDI